MDIDGGGVGGQAGTVGGVARVFAAVTRRRARYSQKRRSLANLHRGNPLVGGQLLPVKAPCNREGRVALGHMTCQLY